MTRDEIEERKVQFEVSDVLLVISIERSVILNGVTPKMLQELSNVYTELENGNYRCGVLYSNNGKLLPDQTFPNFQSSSATGSELFPKDLLTHLI